MLLLFGLLDKYSREEEIFNTLRRRNITVAQMHLLLILASKEKGEWSKMEDLQKYYQKKSRSNRPVAHSTISRAIKNLGEESRYKDSKGRPRDGLGFVDTKQDEDGRFILYCINKRGLDFIERTFNH